MQITRFEVLAGTAEASLDGETIVGRFGHAPLVITNEGRLCETFANCADTLAQVLRFTKKYAPLLTAEPGERFRFPLREWLSYRNRFRDEWKGIARAYSSSSLRKIKAICPKVTMVVPNVFTFGHGSSLISNRDGNVLQQSNFLELIDLCFHGLPWERIRMCPAPECKRPFFVAAHLKQNYCGNSECVAWGDRKAKLSWWNQNKRRLRP
jgi:hypothetical protein